MKYFYFDTETGGLDAQHDALLSIGLVAHDDEKGILETASILVQPEGRNVDPEALAINKINLAEHIKVAGSRRMAGLLVTDFIKRNFGSNPKMATPVGHNIAFDRSFVDPLFPKGWLPYSFRCLDTMGIALFLQHLGMLKEGPLSLDKLTQHFGIVIPEEARHTALGDALGTRELHLALRNLVQTNLPLITE